MLEFEYNLEKELFKLEEELQGLTYEPLEASKRFIVYAPARREISIPAFRDRIVQQALLQAIEPVFEKSFIFDSYAFRIGKGTHSALERFDEFKRKASPRRFPNSGHILKADIKNYYPSVDHNILLRTLKEKITDEKIIKLIEKTLSICPGDKGIAVGSPVSQLFANIYLNELDYFVKHSLKEKFYLRYADDLVVLKNRLKPLKACKQKIEVFLKQSLDLELNLDKTRIISTNKGVDLLGYKIFYFHRLIRKRNLEAFKRRLKVWYADIKQGRLETAKLSQKIKGWIEYARQANSYKLRKVLLYKGFSQ